MEEDDRKALDDMFKGYFEGLKRGDVESVVALYAEDAIQLPPSRDIVYGRKMIKESIEALVQLGFEESVFTGREIAVSGDVAYEMGNYTEKFRPKGKEPFEFKGKYLLVLKRTASGWKIHREIWNTLPPQP